jgi:hypothetical protein
MLPAVVILLASSLSYLSKSCVHKSRSIFRYYCSSRVDCPNPKLMERLPTRAESATAAGCEQLSSAWLAYYTQIPRLIREASCLKSLINLPPRGATDERLYDHRPLAPGYKEIRPIKLLPSATSWPQPILEVDKAKQPFSTRHRNRNIPRESQNGADGQFRARTRGLHCAIIRLRRQRCSFPTRLCR